MMDFCNNIVSDVNGFRLDLRHYYIAGSCRDSISTFRLRLCTDQTF